MEDRFTRINEINEKYQKEVEIIDQFLLNPFTRGGSYKDIRKMPSFIHDNNQKALSAIVWPVNLILWGILIYGIKSIKSILLSVSLFLCVFISMVFLSNTLNLFVFCKKRKRELKSLIRMNQSKLLKEQK